LLASAQAEMLRQQTTNAFEIQSAQAQVDQAQAQIDLAKAELEKARIVSSVTGTIVRKYMHPGEVIDALHPQPVVTVADMTRLRVRADVDEADFPRIRVGQRVKITADALEEGRSFPGTVESISPITGQKRFSTGDARERMDVKIVETVVKFDTPPPPQFVKLGLRVTALFEVAE
jgi:multidrug resistance efflux pump